MQGISVLGLVAEGKAHARTAAPREAPLFQTVFLPRHNFFGRGLLLSAILHCLCIFGGPPLSDLLPESDTEALQRLSMRSLEIRIPERLYLPAMPEQPAKPSVVRPAPKEAPKPVELAKSQIQQPNLPRARAERIPPPQFKLPERVRRVNEDQTLIQSHLPPELALESQVKLPQLILMSAPMLPRPEPRRFVEPGRSAAPTVAARIDAPPQLAPPSAADSDLKIASMLAGPEQAVLRLPKPTVQAKPFQVPAPIPSGRGASVSPTLGEPISILALSADPAPIQERVILPVGNQISRLMELPAYPAPIEPNAGPGKPGTAGPKSGTDAGSVSAGAGGGQALLGELAKALAALPARYITPIRVIHPVNAVFDVVVQTATDQAVPESVGALSGQPIYTVYLEVGAPKAWLLQYCIPKEVSDAPKIVAGAVNIGNPAPLKAPFPLTTVLPPVTMLPRASYIIVHGFVDASGKIKNPLVLRTPNVSYKEPILAELSKWQFRPAVRNGAPMTVEVLLAIPPQQL